MSTWEIIFYPEDRGTFERIKTGKKTIESRALAAQNDKKSYYGEIKSGDTIIFYCENDKVFKKVKDVRKYLDYEEYLAKEDQEKIIGSGYTKEDARKKHYSFEGYRERLERYGIVAIELVKEEVGV